MGTVAVFPPALLAATSQTGRRWFAFPSAVFLSRADGPAARDWIQHVTRTVLCLRSILDSRLCRKLERKRFLKVVVFSSRFFCIFSLNLFRFSRPVLCFTVSSFSLSAGSCLVTAAENTTFPVMLLHNKSVWGGAFIVKKLQENKCVCLWWFFKSTEGIWTSTSLVYNTSLRCPITRTV